MRTPLRPTSPAPFSSRPHARRLVSILLGVLFAVTAATLTLGGGTALPAAAASFTFGVSAGQVGQAGAVGVSGTKSAESTLTIELRPPGNSWHDVTGSCSGVGVGSTSWSCSLGTQGERPLGSHNLRFTETTDGASVVTTGHFVVVPPAALKTTPVTPPPPPPTPEPTPEVTPDPEPEPEVRTPVEPNTPNVQRPAPSAPTPPAPEVPVASPPVELPTESFAEPAVATPDVVRSFAPLRERPDRNDPAAPSALGEGLPDIWENPIRLLLATGMGALFLLLVAVPAEILNSTLEENAHRWRWMYAWALPVVDRVSHFMAKIPAWGSSAPVVIVLTSFAFGFADPNFGFDLTSLRLVASLAIGLLLVVHLPNMITAAVLGRRWAVPTAIITQPGAIIIAVIGVLASRALEFSPGLLIGLVLGIELAAGARAEDRRRAVTVRMIATLVISVLAWAGYAWITAALAGAEETFLSVFISETLVAAVHEGITGLLVALLPLVFLEGKTLFDSSKLTWVALAGPTAVAFALLVLPTSEGLDADAPILVWIGVFVGFCLVVAAIWLTFRILQSREDRAVPAGGERPGESVETASADYVR